MNYKIHCFFFNLSLYLKLLYIFVMVWLCFLLVNVSSRIVPVCFRSIDVVDDETPWITEKKSAEPLHSTYSPSSEISVHIHIDSRRIIMPLVRPWHWG